MDHRTAGNIDVDVRLTGYEPPGQQGDDRFIEPQERKQLLKDHTEYDKLDFTSCQVLRAGGDISYTSLLIRMHYAHHKVADDFLKGYRQKYDECKGGPANASTKYHPDIVNQYFEKFPPNPFTGRTG